MTVFIRQITRGSKPIPQRTKGNKITTDFPGFMEKNDFSEDTDSFGRYPLLGFFLRGI